MAAGAVKAQVGLMNLDKSSEKMSSGTVIWLWFQNMALPPVNPEGGVEDKGAVPKSLLRPKAKPGGVALLPD